MLTSGVVLVCLGLSALGYNDETRFVSGQRALAIPFELRDGIIYLRVSVNGSPLLSFNLDTGASYTVLNLSLAKSLGVGLQSLGKIEGGSGAATPEYYRVTDGVSFRLPGVVFTSQGVVAMALDKVQGCIDNAAADGSASNAAQSARKGLDGILGKDFFSSLVVEVNYTARRINLYDPHSYQYRGKGQSLPLEIGGFIYVQAQIRAKGRKPITARLMVDTGASAPLSLTKQFIEANRLLPPVEKLREVKDCGIGGFANEKSWVGSLDALQLGGVRLSNPVTVFLQDAAASEYDGTLGNIALSNFYVIFDYARRRMILAPSSRAP